MLNFDTSEWHLSGNLGATYPNFGLFRPFTPIHVLTKLENDWSKFVAAIVLTSPQKAPKMANLTVLGACIREFMSYLPQYRTHPNYYPNTKFRQVWLRLLKNCGLYRVYKTVTAMTDADADDDRRGGTTKRSLCVTTATRRRHKNCQRHINLKWKHKYYV